MAQSYRALAAAANHFAREAVVIHAMLKIGLRRIRGPAVSLLKMVNIRYPGKKNMTTKSKIRRIAPAG